MGLDERRRRRRRNFCENGKEGIITPTITKGNAHDAAPAASPKQPLRKRRTSHSSQRRLPLLLLLFLVTLLAPGWNPQAPGSVLVLGEAASSSSSSSRVTPPTNNNGQQQRKQQPQQVPPPPRRPTTPPPPRPPPLRTAKRDSSSSDDNKDSKVLLRVVETEVYDANLQQWTGDTRNRWSRLDGEEEDASGRPCESPADLKAPKGGEFEGDWKIVLGGERDAYGWQYLYSNTAPSTTSTSTTTTSTAEKRQRIWLRTVRYKVDEQLQTQQQKKQKEEQDRATEQRNAKSEQTKIKAEQDKEEPKKQKVEADTAVTTKSKHLAPKVKSPVATKASATTPSPPPPASSSATKRSTRTRQQQQQPVLQRPLLPASWSKKLQRSQAAQRLRQPQPPRPPPNLLPALQSLLQACVHGMQDDWNFKGFGWSFYKSAIFKKSCGVAFRIPLTSNFDIWERHPEWPSLSMSVAIYYPLTAGIFVSGSVNAAWAKWALHQAAMVIRHVIAWTMLLVARGLFLAGAALAFPITQQWYTPETATILANNLLPPLQQTLEKHGRKPNFNTGIQERIGIGHSWRVSSKRGYEYRCTYWHMFLPTIITYLQVIDPIWQSWQRWMYAYNNNSHRNIKSNKKASVLAFAMSKPSSTTAKSSSTTLEESDSEDDELTTTAATSSSNKEQGNKKPLVVTSLLEQSRNSQWADWLLQRKTGSLGLSTGYPIPDKPYFSCSAFLSLSGFYFQKQQKQQKQQQQSSKAAASAAARGLSSNTMNNQTTITTTTIEKQTEPDVKTIPPLLRTAEDNHDNNSKATTLASSVTTTTSGTAITTNSNKKTTTNA